MTVLTLINHPNLDKLLVPVIQKLMEKGIKVIVLIAEYGQTALLDEKNIVYTKNMDVIKQIISADGNKLFLNAADLVHSHHLGKEIVNLFREYQIQSLTLEHASFALSVNRFLPRHQFSSDKMALIGEMDYQKYYDLGVNNQRLVVTGSPAYDLYYDKHQIHKNQPTDKVIVIFGQNHAYTKKGPEHTDREWVQVLRDLYLSLINNFPDYKIQVKPHPAEPDIGTEKLYYYAFESEMDDCVSIVDSKSPNEELISNAEIVFSFSNSIVLESLLLDTKCLLFEHEVEDRSNIFKDFEKEGVFILNSLPHEIPSQLNRSIDSIQNHFSVSQSPTSQEFIKKYVYKFDGRSAERVSDLIYSMINNIEYKENIEAPLAPKAGSAPKLVRPTMPKIGYERYVRLMGIADEVNSDTSQGYSLLDIGGEDAAFKEFVTSAQYSAYNGFISVDKRTPYPDNSFDVVVASDVLEHVPVIDREAFIKELVRIAKQKVVFSFPTEISNKYEQFILKLLPEHRWLKEHQENGLPNKDDVERIIKECGFKYTTKANHNLTSWVYSVIFDHLQIDPKAREMINSFLQTENFNLESTGLAYRYIYTITK